MRIQHLHLVSYFTLFFMSLNVFAAPIERKDPFLHSENLLLPMKAVVISKDIRLRDQPSLSKTQVVDVLPYGTPVTILERNQEKIHLMGQESHWFKVKTLSQKEGWLFGKFLSSEQSDFLKDQMDTVLKALEASRPQVAGVATKISETNVAEVKSALNHVKPSSLNYVAYHLIRNQHPNAFPVLLEYMNPQYKNEHSKDANYAFNWEILSRLMPSEMVPADYEAFAAYWKREGSQYQFPLSRAEVFAILLKIRDRY